MDKRLEDLKNHIKLLSEKRNLWRNAMEFLQEGILIIENGREISFYNSSFIKHLDISIKGGILSIDDIKSHPIFGKILKETQKTDFMHYTRGVEIYSPWKKFLNIRAIALDKKRPMRSIAYIVQDETFEKVKQDETFQQKKLGAVLSLGAGFAHELGNPLNSLNIHLQLVSRMLSKGELCRSDLDSLKKEITIMTGEIKRMDNLISNFLKATRPEKIQFREINIIDTIKLSLESLQSIAKNRGISINFKSSFERRFIFADNEKIQQVIINIVKNAIEAIGENGFVNVFCQGSDSNILITIRDNGPGIPLENISKIFDPFFTTKKSGVGLGLVISYQIIKEHGGEISVKSHPGKGTTFLIKLPLREYKLKFIEAKRR